MFVCVICGHWWEPDYRVQMLCKELQVYNLFFPLFFLVILLQILLFTKNSKFYYLLICVCVCVSMSECMCACVHMSQCTCGGQRTYWRVSSLLLSYGFMGPTDWAQVLRLGGRHLYKLSHLALPRPDIFLAAAGTKAALEEYWIEWTCITTESHQRTMGRSSLVCVFTDL